MRPLSSEETIDHSGGQNNAVELAAALKKHIEGEVRFDTGARAIYSMDASNYRQVPTGVVIPRTIDDVLTTVEVVRSFDASILARGGGTSLAGQCCNTGVVIDMSKYLNRIIEIDPERRTARVQPGVVLDQLNRELKPHRLMFGPDPSTHQYCTLGGMIGNNSCGVHSVIAGRTSDNVESLDILTYDGERFKVGQTSDIDLQYILNMAGRRAEIYGALKGLRDRHAAAIRERYPKIPRRVSGYNLDELLPENGFHVARALVGSECTCALVLEATVDLVYSPPARSLLVLGYPDIFHAADHVPEIMEVNPIGLESVDHILVENMRKKGLHPGDLKLLPDGRGFLLVEFGGETKQESDDAAIRLIRILSRHLHPPAMKLFDNAAEEKLVWEIRESGLGATARVPSEPDTWPGWEDSAVPPDQLGNYLRDLRKLFDKYGYECALYGHFGQGCVHTRIDFDLKSPAGVRKYESFIHEAAHTVVGYGGSLSGEHGDGQSRAELLPIMFGDEITGTFREFKRIWDPGDRMNPGKVVMAARADEHLKFAAGDTAWRPQTYFQFPDDDGDFLRATERCVGVGKCRRSDGGTMCPSFMVTHDELHTTRGRAHMLWSMLQRDPIVGEWKDENVREALDLCLACKGCKGDCPVNVDMATYKAEFLAHYYEGRLRPRSAYAMGGIFWWARLASLLPRLANFISQTPPFSLLAKLAGGIAAERPIPAFAEETFKDWFRNRTERSAGKRSRVILWADTFTNHFEPEIAKSAVEVLEAAGFEVKVPAQAMCCGRPLYDFGFLQTAKKLLVEILENLRPEIQSGTPLVVLEPSCASTFRDELINMLPDEPLARQLKDLTYSLSGFLTERAKDFRPGSLDAAAILQGHCHQKSLERMDSEESLLRRLGVRFESPEPGCCGMAGAFGFEAQHYEISMQCAEKSLAPAIRSAAKNTLLIADGFSCRQQIRSATGREPIHLAQAIHMAMTGESGAVSTPVRQTGEYSAARISALALTGIAVVAAGGLLWKWKRSQ